ncbi:uncharacterized protein N7529_001760 [Penicillium soppii]|uniref:uncharacterized protein n=1 Tax=Penicillium soppii TaxID=69789 RepID=UPI002549BAE5|nr:uncharacterized protein N7529_001760 [Penicillium soppii]KAJ5876176.1 hypothetical protein N7529_001760 [Penicillium soppii]
MEWLFSYWDITSDTLLARALDSDDPHNRDWNGDTMLNTGLMIAQESPRARELFEAWESCPNETRYPSCAKCSGEWIIFDLPCAEANGCPEVATTGWVGELIRHYWGNKKSLTATAGDVVQYFLPQLHGLFYQNLETVVVNMTEGDFV